MIRVVGRSVVGTYKQSWVKTTVANRRCFSVDATEWLAQQGYRNEMAADMIKAFSDGGSSAAAIKTMSPAMLEQLSKAVAREWEMKKEKSNRPVVNIKIMIPAERHTIEMAAHEGDSMIDLVAANELLKQYVVCACGGNATCSTCHIFIDDPFYYNALDPAEEHEQDMLDLAHSSEEGKSRLGCQLSLNSDCEGITFRVPDSVNNMM
jgi:ferredoxin